MAQSRKFTMSFSTGEVTPEVYTRYDLTKITAALATCRNFVTLPHGPVHNRTGTQYIAEVSDSTQLTRLIPFTFADTQTFAIELGAGHFRFYTMGETLLVGAVTAWSAGTAYAVGDLATSLGINYYCILAHTNEAPPNATYWYRLPADGAYEIPNPYAVGDLFSINYVQSDDVMTLVHPNYPPMELRRLGGTDWVLVPIAFQPGIEAPSGVVLTPDTGGGTTNQITYKYVVTAVSSAIGLEESLPSASVSALNNLSLVGNYNKITWNAQADAALFYVYAYANGIYGYIGSATGTQFTDNNITPDLTQTPPMFDTGTFVGAGNYPRAVTYFEQRRVFAGTINQPQNLWATRSGTESNLGYTIPSQDDNAIRLKIAGRDASQILHLVPVANLILLTPSSEYRAASNTGDALTPSDVAVRPQSYIGASTVQPCVINTSVMFAQARGGHVREMSFNTMSAYSYGLLPAYLSNDISLLAPHLFDYMTINEMAFAKSPYPIMWCISSSGNLLGLTYVPEQQISAWHHHDTVGGVFEACCVIAEANEDMLYVIVNRTINGQTKRYVERMSTRNFPTQADSFFVDSGLTYNGAPQTTFTGVDHLEGQTVAVLADGAVMPQQVIVGGSFTLPAAASKVQVGLPITADFETLPLVVPGTPDYGQGHYKNVNNVWLRVNNSSGIAAGPTFDKVISLKQRTTEAYGSPPGLISGEFKLTLTPTWAEDGQVCVRQMAPLPLTIVSLTVEAEIGG